MKKENDILEQIIEFMENELTNDKDKGEVIRFLMEQGYNKDFIDFVTSFFIKTDEKKENSVKLKGIRLFNKIERKILTDDILEYLTKCKYFDVLSENDMEKVVDLLLNAEKVVTLEDAKMMVRYVSGIDIQNDERPYR